MQDRINEVMLADGWVVESGLKLVDMYVLMIHSDRTNLNNPYPKEGLGALELSVWQLDLL